ncbi:PPP1R21.2 family protein [Megaselia abdita]
MDTANSSNLPLETKYQKLAQEYQKLRSQAAVLKKAFLAEQSKTSSIRENLRQKETQLRKSETETDSLNFRNKQMERRIIALQEDFSKESNKKQSGKDKVRNVAHNSSETDPLLFAELQKKIIENAQLTSVIDDKNRELDIQSSRLDELGKKLEQQRVENSELEKRLRKEIDNLLSRNTEMETKLVDAGSIVSFCCSSINYS